MTSIIRSGGRILCRFCVFCCLLAPLAEAMEVHDVVGLVQAGVDDHTIMAIVRKTGAVFSLSAEERQQLRGAGASEQLMAFLSNPSVVPPPPVHTRPPMKTGHSPSFPSKKLVAPSVPPSPAQQQNLAAGLGQERPQDQKEPWQGHRQGSRSQPTRQSPPIQSQGGIPHPQVMEIPPVQLPEEGRQTQAVIPSREQQQKKEQSAAGREAAVTVTVTDREGSYITGLGKEDLRLSEDGVSQEILSLTPDQHTP